MSTNYEFADDVTVKFELLTRGQGQGQEVRFGSSSVNIRVDIQQWLPVSKVTQLI